MLLLNFSIFAVMSLIFFKDFICLFLEGEKGGGKGGREAPMYERNIDWLPPT